MVDKERFELSNPRGEEIYSLRALATCILVHKLAERTGLEPVTPRVTGEYSDQLNYRSKISRADNDFSRITKKKHHLPCDFQNSTLELGITTESHEER